MSPSYVTARLQGRQRHEHGAHPRSPAGRTLRGTGAGGVRRAVADRLTPESVLQLQRTVGNAAVADLVRMRAGHGVAVQRSAGNIAIRGARALGKRLIRGFGVRGSQLLYKAAARRALHRLEQFGIDKAVAAHIAEHFTMVAGKVSHSLFDASLRSTKAVTGLVTETLKKGGSSAILSVTDSGALAWVFEAELGRTIGAAGKQALTKLRVVVDLQGRLITAFPIRAFTTTITLRGLGGLRVTLASALALLAVQGIYENEAAAAVEARRRFDEANDPSWWEYLVPWGPASTFGYEPNPGEIAERGTAVIAELEATLGATLDADTRAGVRDDVRHIWTASGEAE